MQGNPEVAPPSLAATLPNEILAEMVRRRLSRTDLAARIGAPYHWLAARLNGETRITIADVERIAAGLDMSAVELMMRCAP